MEIILIIFFSTILKVTNTKKNDKMSTHIIFYMIFIIIITVSMIYEIKLIRNDKND